MGNCSPKPSKPAPVARSSDNFWAAAAAYDDEASAPPPPPRRRPPVILYGPEACPEVSRLRIGLLYKNLAVEFYAAGDSPVLENAGEKVSGSLEKILRYADEKFPGPAITEQREEQEEKREKGFVGTAVKLQHKSIERHLERMVRWGEAMAEGLEKGKRGSPRLEMKRFGRSYGQLAEMMMEHAQMEERVIFPLMDRADPDLCALANKEHAQELPMMNGIKEDFKSIFVLDPGGASHREALLNLSHRLRLLQERCREHFAEEERDLLPLLGELTAEEPESRRPAPDQLLELMEATHGHLFNFFISGLLPHETIQYLGVLCKCRDVQRVMEILRPLEARLDAAGSSATKSLGGLLKATPLH